MTTLSSITKSLLKQSSSGRLTLLGLAGLLTGCNTALAQNNDAPTSTPPVLPTLRATPTPLAARPDPSPQPVTTPWPTLTPWPTATPWPAPAAWRPVLAPLPTLSPLPVVPPGPVQPGGVGPVSYAPPDGVDVFGNVQLRWTYHSPLAEDEFFDIKIKPAGSNDSAFVAWSKTPEYLLQPWSGWQPGLYTWQIGIVKGYLEGETKHFIADTGRDSQPFLIKWQAAGGGGGGRGSSSGGGGGGNSSGGS